ncbi:TPA: hypothetical protein TT917_000719 [Streptococcus equi subsp. zooepidemicus]|nr:hypothetical protein [Streptococcus equi subsp. zooepidemicus]HEL0021987.1 hypothetical protein [Streptococcus equi subsp. zooepidemicus]HEL0039920.1 hypothetical protein [Streptococcus equi subsp. zooepidemicus]HEL0041902.1 hypothetical protein [Streptococcus equi subsp. zooepidemicus]HEL0043902.1 hypothetical protein [Streptococcus equi subsp. zooepidemicus]
MKKSTKAFIALMILIGGLFTVFSLNGKRTEEQQKRDLETSIAKLLVHDYEGVETIKFTGWGHSRETGSWGTTVIVNIENEVGFTFSDLSGLKEISSIVFSPSKKDLVEKKEAIENPHIFDRIDSIKDTSIDEVKITYFSKNKGD